MQPKRRNTFDSLTAEQEHFLAGTPPPVQEALETPPRPLASLVERMNPPAASRPTVMAIHQNGTPGFQTVRPITVRLRLQTAQAMRRACAQRSIDYVQPYTQQDIMEEALVGWLRSQGYLLEEDHSSTFVTPASS